MTITADNGLKNPEHKRGKKIAVYPGCSLEASAKEFMVSLDGVMKDLEIEYNVLPDWSCCGATSAHAVDHRLHLALNLRNLAIAEDHNITDLLVPCAACYHRLASANNQLVNDEKLLAHMNNETGLHYSGTVRVRNVLDFIAHDIGTEKIISRSSSDKQHIRGLTAACYYGCLNTRIPRMKTFDNVEYPMTMDRLVQAIGGKTVDWSYKTECCGASHFITNEKSSHSLVAKILQNAVDCGADYIVVACPMCHNNLHMKQKKIRKTFKIQKELPIYFITKLIGDAIRPHVKG